MIRILLLPSIKKKHPHVTCNNVVKTLPYRKYTLCLPRLHHGGFIVFFQERFLFRNGRACMFFLESNLLYNVTHNITLWNCV